MKERDVLGELLEAAAAADEAGEVPIASPAHSERFSTELLGLLPQALDPVEPSAATTRALFDEIKSTVKSKAQSPNSHRESHETTVSATWRWQSRAGWIAAALALLTVGLTGTGLWMFDSPRPRSPDLARLRQILNQTTRSEVAQHPLAVLLDPRSMLCRLRPVGRSPAQPLARGEVFLGAGTGHWLMTARNLAIPPAGSGYRIWFLEEGRPVASQSFDVRDKGVVLLGSDDLPHGVDAIRITLESELSPQGPRGPTILYGDETERML